jgi:hypothetical protein
VDDHTISRSRSSRRFNNRDSIFTAANLGIYEGSDIHAFVNDSGREVATESSRSDAGHIGISGSDKPNWRCGENACEQSSRTHNDNDNDTADENGKKRDPIANEFCSIKNPRLQRLICFP